MLGFMFFLLYIQNLVFFFPPQISPARIAQNLVSCVAKAVPEHQGTREEQVKWEQKRKKIKKKKKRKIEGEVRGDYL